MKINAVTLVRDSAKFIVPHLNMYQGVDRNIVLFIPQVLSGGASGHAKQRDNSLELIKKHCPNVEVFETEINEWGAPIFNEAARIADDGGKTVMLHADVVLSQKTWNTLLTLLKETDYDVYRLDMTKCTINYYHDFEHGIRDCLDNEPIAYKSHIRFGGIYELPPGHTSYTINDPSFEVHHFCGWKGIFATKDWLESRVPSESNVYANAMEPKDGWLPCPQEIRDLFV